MIIAFEYQDQLIPFFHDGSYVNLTTMCRAFKQRPDRFLGLESTSNYIAALAAKTGLPLRAKLPENRAVKLSENPTIKLPGKPVVSDSRPSTGIPYSVEAILLTEEGRNGSTWAHRLLAMECARWLSPDFAIWCNQIVLALVSGELAHPAMDRVDHKHREARIEERKRATEQEQRAYWKSREVAGNVATRVYLRALGLRLDVRDSMGLGSDLRQRAQGYGYAVGRMKIRRTRNGKREDNCGWQEVSTYPPAEIHAALLRRGLITRDTPPPLPRILDEITAQVTHRLCSALPPRSAVEDPAAHAL